MSTNALYELRCRECRKTWGNIPRSFCEDCFSPLEVAYDYDSLKKTTRRENLAGRDFNMWRYAELLPLPEGFTGPNAVGGTPLVASRKLASRWGLKNLYFKNDAVCFPSLSFKDRVVATALSAARRFNFTTVGCSSTGNLANAVAAHAAAAGLDSYVFVPANLEEQKLLATGIYGTNLVGVRGNYDDVNRLCTQLAETRPWAFVNVNLRPYYAEGSKTLAYETAEQLGWELPDRVVCPIASGSLFTKVGRGFQEWLDIGLVEGSLPVFNGAQAQGCSPVATAFAEGWDVCKPQKPETIAKSLAIGDPADGPYALEQARRSGGAIDSVTDEEIRAGIRLLAETTGIFTETAGGVTLGVLTKLAERGDISAGERVVIYITGEGLKTLDAARDSFHMHEIDPDLDSFESVFEHQEVAA